MRLQGGVGNVPFSLFFKKKKRPFFLWVGVYTHIHQASNLKKLSVSNCPKLLKVIFPSLRSQNVQVLDWFLFFPFWNPVLFLKTQLLLVISLAWHSFCLTCECLSRWLREPQELSLHLILLISPHISQSSWHPQYLTQTLNNAYHFYSLLQ